MLQHQTFLRCSQTTAFLIFLTIGALFIITGCKSIYKTLGMTDAQADAQVAKDQATIQIITDTTRTTAAEIITQIIAGAGVILSGFLAKWLGTEKKITKALITGIEQAPNNNVKASITSQALSAGVESQLHARVKALT